MELVTKEIENALRLLSIPPNSFRLLPTYEGSQLYKELLANFVEGGDRRWWWEAFSKPSSSKTFENGKGFEKITQLVPNPEEVVWFVVEEDQLPFYPIYEATPAVIQTDKVRSRERSEPRSEPFVGQPRWGRKFP